MQESLTCLFIYLCIYLLTQWYTNKSSNLLWRWNGFSWQEITVTLPMLVGAQSIKISLMRWTRSIKLEWCVLLTLAYVGAIWVWDESRWTVQHTLTSRVEVVTTVTVTWSSALHHPLTSRGAGCMCARKRGIAWGYTHKLRTFNIS